MELPNGQIEIVLSFDTTGSMCGCINEVKACIQDMVQRLQADIPGIRIGVLAHGDYIDVNANVTKYEDFTDDVPKLCNFVNDVDGTCGGDPDQCYELALYQVRTRLSWTPGSQRALVVIGGSNPHPVDYAHNKLKLDWRKEADALGAEIYEKEVRAKCAGAVKKDLHQLFGDLRNSSPESSSRTSANAQKTAAKVTKPRVTMKKTKTAINMKKKTRELKSLEKDNIRKLPLLRRENVPDCNFKLRDMSWSPWQLAIKPEAGNSDWTQRTGDG